MTYKHLPLDSTKSTSAECAEALDSLCLTLVVLPDHIVDNPLFEANKKIAGQKRASDHAAELQAQRLAIRLAAQPSAAERGDASEEALSSPHPLDASGIGRLDNVIAKSHQQVDSSRNVSLSSGTETSKNGGKEIDKAADHLEHANISCMIVSQNNTLYETSVSGWRLYFGGNGGMRMAHLKQVVITIKFESVFRVYIGSERSALLEFKTKTELDTSPPRWLGVKFASRRDLAVFEQNVCKGMKNGSKVRSDLE